MKIIYMIIDCFYFVKHIWSTIIKYHRGGWYVFRDTPFKYVRYVAVMRRFNKDLHVDLNRFISLAVAEVKLRKEKRLREMKRD